MLVGVIAVVRGSEALAGARRALRLGHGPDELEAALASADRPAGTSLLRAAAWLASGTALAVVHPYLTSVDFGRLLERAAEAIGVPLAFGSASKRWSPCRSPSRPCCASRREAPRWPHAGAVRSTGRCSPPHAASSRDLPAGDCRRATRACSPRATAPSSGSIAMSPQPLPRWSRAARTVRRRARTRGRTRGTGSRAANRCRTARSGPRRGAARRSRAPRPARRARRAAAAPRDGRRRPGAAPPRRARPAHRYHHRRPHRAGRARRGHRAARLGAPRCRAIPHPHTDADTKLTHVAQR